METLESLRNRINTTEQLQSLVRSMKSLSAASINQYERAVTALEDYGLSIESGLQAVLMNRTSFSWPSTVHSTTTGVIVVGSDRGLCGRFNALVTERAHLELEKLRAQDSAVKLIAIGARAQARLEAMGHRVERTFRLPGSARNMSVATESILIALDVWRQELGIEHVLLISNRREEQSRALPTVKALLPIDTSWLAALGRQRWPTRGLPIFAVSPNELFAWLIRQHLFISLFETIAESLAAEHAARLSAMQTAEQKIKEHLEDANARFRRERQNAITVELMDLVTGFEALKSLGIAD